MSLNLLRTARTVREDVRLRLGNEFFRATAVRGRRAGRFCNCVRVHNSQAAAVCTTATATSRAASSTTLLLPLLLPLVLRRLLRRHNRHENPVHRRQQNTVIFCVYACVCVLATFCFNSAHARARKHMCRAFCANTALRTYTRDRSIRARAIARRTDRSDRWAIR